jgi:membrane-associated phospholipid phosphatase
VVGFVGHPATPSCALHAKFLPSTVVRLHAARPPLLAALAALLALGITGVLALYVPGVRLRDAATLDGFVALDRPRTEPVASGIAHLADPLPFALIGLALVTLALARGRRAVALAIPVVLVGSGATTQLLKLLIAEPRFADSLGTNQISPASWPSGHATAAMALALCAILAAPPRLRPMAALAGGAFSIAVSYAVLVLAWHFPSDVMGGFLVSAIWALLAVAALEAIGARRSVASPPLARIIVAGLAGGAAWAGAAALVRPDAAAGFALAHPAFLPGAGAIALTAVAVAAGLARATRV